MFKFAFYSIVFYRELGMVDIQKIEKDEYPSRGAILRKIFPNLVRRALV